MDPTFQMLMAALEAVPVFGPILPYVPLVCLAASIFDAVFPQPAPGSAWASARAVLHVLSLGVANARPALPAPPLPVPAPAAAIMTELTPVATLIATGEAAAAIKGPNSLAPVPSGIAHMFGLLAVLGITAAVLSACTSAQVLQAVSDGQLVCAVGPDNVVALADPQGAAVLAKGSPKAFVDAACAAINGVAVSPPGMPVRTVTITPPTITVPIGAAQ